jgi:hypothetical protein
MKPIKIDKTKIFHSSGYNHIYIHERSMEEFIESKPPCAECIVQPACLSYTEPVYVEYVDAAYEEFLTIKINACDNLKRFIVDNNQYQIYNNEPERRRKGKEEKKMNKNKWRDPEPDEINTPEFNSIWDCIRHWDIGLPQDITIDGGQLYSGANGNHVIAILDALRKDGIIK